MSDILDLYPSLNEIKSWISELHSEADSIKVGTEVIDPNLFEWPYLNNLPFQYAARHHSGAAYVQFSRQFQQTGTEERFFAFWQPSFNQPAPLLVHVPGYGAEMSVHPELVADGYNVLHINPLGYCSPNGMAGDKVPDNTDPLSWPQLPDTIVSLGKSGYRQWFLDCIHAISWSLRQESVLPGRLSFFGTSQGGGAAIILSSIYRDGGVRCVAADVPFLTNFPLADGRGAYEIVKMAFDTVDAKDSAWHALGFFDTLAHAERLNFPVLLTAAELDEMCPPETIHSLFEKLNCTRSFHYINGREHSYTPEFLHLCRAWFRMYA